MKIIPLRIVKIVFIYNILSNYLLSKNDITFPTTLPTNMVWRILVFYIPKPDIEYMVHIWIIMKIKGMLADVIITPQNDIDLRVIAAPAVKRTSDSIKADDIEPATKKSKTEIIDE